MARSFGQENSLAWHKTRRFKYERTPCDVPAPSGPSLSLALCLLRQVCLKFLSLTLRHSSRLAGRFLSQHQQRYVPHLLDDAMPTINPTPNPRRSRLPETEVQRAQVEKPRGTGRGHIFLCDFPDGRAQGQACKKLVWTLYSLLAEDLPIPVANDSSG
jgi:hypothetical protein